jgi:hypothetical protein
VSDIFCVGHCAVSPKQDGGVGESEKDRDLARSTDLKVGKDPGRFEIE